MFNSSHTGSLNGIEFSANLQEKMFQEDPHRNWNPCHWAAYYGQCDSLRMLFSAFPNIIHVQSSKTGQTPLHCASEAGHSQCVLFLLEAGSNPDVKDNFGEIALHKACRIGNAESVELLISASSNISAVNSIGQTASVVATFAGHSRIAGLVRSKEAVFGMDRFWGTNNNHSNMSLTGLRRKRTHDAMIDGGCKRVCREDSILPSAPVAVSGVFNITLSPDMNVTSSVVEHEKLCKVDQGYTNSILEMMIHEYHGC